MANEDDKGFRNGYQEAIKYVSGCLYDTFINVDKISENSTVYKDIVLYDKDYNIQINRVTNCNEKGEEKYSCAKHAAEPRSGDKPAAGKMFLRAQAGRAQ